MRRFSPTMKINKWAELRQIRGKKWTGELKILLTSQVCKEDLQGVPVRVWQLFLTVFTGCSLRRQSGEATAAPQTRPDRHRVAKVVLARQRLVRDERLFLGNFVAGTWVGNSSSQQPHWRHSISRSTCENWHTCKNGLQKKKRTRTDYRR